MVEAEDLGSGGGTMQQTSFPSRGGKGRGQDLFSDCTPIPSMFSGSILGDTDEDCAGEMGDNLLISQFVQLFIR